MDELLLQKTEVLNSSHPGWVQAPSGIYLISQNSQFPGGKAQLLFLQLLLKH